MSEHVPVALRRLVIFRAGRLCEYCLIHEEDTFLGCEVEHIISTKHGGATSAENLACACVFCNRHKGSDIATHWPRGDAGAPGELVRLYNPRTDRWAEHFSLRDPEILGQTRIGAATAALLQFNHIDRIAEWEALRLVGRFPSPEAMERI